MRTVRLLLLTLSLAATAFAGTRDWKHARVVDSSETDVSGEMRASKNTVHYTIETQDALYFVDYTYKPDQHSDNRPPDLAVNVETKIAIEGKHAYILDVTGKEVKLHIVKKKVKQ